jgi:hypothetical protein
MIKTYDSARAGTVRCWFGRDEPAIGDRLSVRPSRSYSDDFAFFGFFAAFGGIVAT